MLLRDDGIPAQPELDRCAEDGPRVFLAAYGRRPSGPPDRAS